MPETIGKETGRPAEGVSPVQCTGLVYMADSLYHRHDDGDDIVTELFSSGQAAWRAMVDNR